MSRTRRLLGILFFLIALMALYFTLKNYDEVTSYISRLIRKYTQNEIVIPEYTKNHRKYLFKTVSETNNFEPQNIDEIKKIYYTVLNNGWDTFTFYCPYEYTECINDVKRVANTQSDEHISVINNYVSPFNSYIKFNTTILDENQVTVKVERLYTDDEIERLNNIVDSYIKQLKVDTNNVKLRDIENIHDFLLKKITYDTAYQKGDDITDSNKATGALINGVALCSGYTDAFALFLDKLNIPNFKVNSEEHEWNVVYFNNKWSHIDLTWDDDEININNNRNFFMVNTKELLTKDKKEHNFDQNLYLELK